jgi:hypothetical protein
LVEGGLHRRLKASRVGDFGIEAGDVLTRLRHGSTLQQRDLASEAVLIYRRGPRSDAMIAAAFQVARVSDKGDEGAAERSGTQRARKPKRS